MKNAIRDSRRLLSALGLPNVASEGLTGEASFPTFVPPALLSRIQSGNPADPILRQVLPVSAEEDPSIQAGFSPDPLAEFLPGSTAATEQGGVPSQKWIKKYQGRALLITTGACGVHCRYCFRRHYPYPAAPQQQTRWQPWLDPIIQDPSISEVILSGGDPLVLSDTSLERLIRGLQAIPHVRWLRIHSRMPVVIPQRITPELLQILSGFEARVMVIHANHAQEIDDQVAQAVQKMREQGFQVLNQAVLLRGVNDSLAALETLSRRLVSCGVVPYYLHQLDRVAGAAHFEVSVEEGRRLIEQLRQRLPGHAVPRYVQEIPGRPYKTILA